MADIARLTAFIARAAEITEASNEESLILAALAPALADLVAQDDWLPGEFAEPDGGAYRQNLLYADALDRFSVVSFVWGPGQHTPVHDHCTWGLVGVLRGGEISTSYAQDGTGRLIPGATERLGPGRVVAVSPSVGDIHRISNAYADRASVSIHIYGGNIGRISRHVYDEATGEKKTFISGYSNDRLPNLWPAP